MGKRRFEYATTGADEALQGLTSDPFSGATGTPNWTGLRIPSLVNTPDTRYLFLLSTRVLNNAKTRILGFRQGLEIGMDLGPQMGITTERPVSMLVTTPTFRFSDGANVSWHLVKEPVVQRRAQQPLTQAPSFAFQQSDTPALIYQTFATSNPTATGAPTNYAIDLTAYTPPPYANDWRPIAGLKGLRDIRYPWQDDRAWDSIDEVVEGASWRVSLYADILQTDPVNRPGIVFGTGIATDGSAVGGPPEEDFIYKYTFKGEGGAVLDAPKFWRVYGSILFEDEIDGGDLAVRLPGEG